jgi:hypothetical protein
MPQLIAPPRSTHMSRYCEALRELYNAHKDKFHKNRRRSLTFSE